MEPTYRGLGFDPTPGDLGAVTRAGAQLIEAADALSGVEPALRRAEEASTDWRGAAAERFRERLRATPAGFGARQRELRRAAGALDRWAGVLVANKRRAEELDQQAVRLRKRLAMATDELADRHNAADLAATAAAAASATVELAAMNTLVSDLEAALAEVLERARRLQREHLRAADTVADELTVDPAADRPARPSGIAGVAGSALRRGSTVAGTLGGLLLPGGRGAAVPVPAGAAAAFAAAVERTSRR